MKKAKVHFDGDLTTVAKSPCSRIYGNFGVAAEG